MATISPSRNRSPRRPSASAASISPASSRARPSAGVSKSSGTSASSEKSMRASISASARMSRSRQLSAARPSAPCIWRSAWRRWPCVSAITRSARPSTAVRSSLPFSKARRVNSPASAGRKPSMRDKRGERRGDHRAAAVQLQLGDVLAGLARRRGKPQRQGLVDRLLVRGSRRRAKAALRGSGILPASALSASPARGPEMRTTAMAAGGRPEERAKMVGRSGIAAQVSAAGRAGQGARNNCQPDGGCANA